MSSILSRSKLLNIQCVSFVKTSQDRLCWSYNCIHCQTSRHLPDTSSRRNSSVRAENQFRPGVVLIPIKWGVRKFGRKINSCLCQCPQQQSDCYQCGGDWWRGGHVLPSPDLPTQSCDHSSTTQSGPLSTLTELFSDGFRRFQTLTELFSDGLWTLELEWLLRSSLVVDITSQRWRQCSGAGDTG